MKSRHFIALFFGSIVLSLSSCARLENGYDQHLFDLVEKANNGNVKAAHDAYDYCTAILKLDDGNLPSIYLGQCGGTIALWIDAAMQTGDPAEIKRALYGFEVSHQDFRKRLPYYKKIARVMIKERCAQVSAPSSCADKDLMNWFEFGLDDEYIQSSLENSETGTGISVTP